MSFWVVPISILSVIFLLFFAFLILKSDGYK